MTAPAPQIRTDGTSRPARRATVIGLLRRFATDARGNIAIMGAGCLMLVIGCAALGVDVGSVFADRRRAQSAADLAAIVAASDLAHATAAAAATVARNNYPSDALQSVELGAYRADASLPPAQRFVAGATPANAVRVTLRTQTPLYFGRALTGSSQYAITTTAVASSTQLVAFAIGSRLASVNGGLLNALLGQMLGASLSLSVMDYQALIAAKVDLFDFLSALATRLNLNGVSYDSVLASNLKVGDIVSALVAVQNASGGSAAASAALNSLALALAGNAAQVPSGTLANVGPYGGLTVGEKPRTGVQLSLLDLLSAAAALANGSRQIATALNLTLPGIAAVSLTAVVGERPVGTSWVTVGSAGASVHTAQTRVLLSVQLVGTGAVSVVNLPLYVEIAPGTATLQQVACGYPDIATSKVTLGVSPGIVEAWIGAVGPADLANLSVKPNPPAAKIVDLGIIQVSGRAHATMANTTPTPVTFSYADILAQTKKTVTTTSYLSSLTGSLLGDLTLTVALGPLGLPIPGIASLVLGIIGGATGSIDTLLAAVLQALGVGLGQADVWVAGLRCDGAVLVN